MDLRIIGVCGVIGSGKSTFSKLLAGHIRATYRKSVAIISTDELFKRVVLNDVDFRIAVYTQFCNMFDFPSIFKNGNYNSHDLTDMFFGDHEGNSNKNYGINKLSVFNSITYPFLLEAVKKELRQVYHPDDTYVILEMATLPNSKISFICNDIIEVRWKIDYSIVENRDKGKNRSPEMYERIVKYQKGCIANGVRPVDRVFKMEHDNIPDLVKTYEWFE